MAAITERFGSGGANLSPGKSGGDPTLATALRDVADDLAALQPTAVAAPVTEAALPAFTDGPTAGEMAALRALVNELRATVIELTAKVTASSGATLLTTKG